MNIIQKPVAEFAKGRQGYKPEGIVIHVGEGSQDVIYQTFMTEEKSAHYCVSRTGDIWQFVQEADTAWAQGNVVRPSASLVTSTHPGVNPNFYLVSIEHEGFGTEDFTEAQYAATSALVRDICLRWAIPINRLRVLRHNEIRADKTCPGIANVDRIVSMAIGNIVPAQPLQDKSAIKQQIIDLLQKI